MVVHLTKNYMKHIGLFFIFYCLSFLSNAQVVNSEDPNEDFEERKTKSLISEFTSIKDYKKRLFLGLGNTLFLDFVTSPLTYTTVQYFDPPASLGGPNVPRYENAAVQTSYTSIYTLSIEPRYNLIEPLEDLSFAAVAPLAIGLGQTGPTDQYVVQGGFGFGNIQFALLAAMYYGCNSTKNAGRDFGINLAAGYEVNKIGVINASSEPNMGVFNRIWAMPTARVGVQFYRGYTPVEIYIKYGFGSVQDQLIDGNGNNLVAGKLAKRASSLKLAIVYSLD